MKALLKSALRAIIAILSAFCLMIVLHMSSRMSFSFDDIFLVICLAAIYGTPAFLYLLSSKSTPKLMLKLFLICSVVGLMTGFGRDLMVVSIIITLIPASVSLMLFCKVVNRYSSLKRKRFKQILAEQKS